MISIRLAPQSVVKRPLSTSSAQAQVFHILYTPRRDTSKMVAFSMSDGISEQARHSLCAQCGVALAHDQRYCVECGARRGPLCGAIAALIGTGTESARLASRGPAGAVEVLESTDSLWQDPVTDLRGPTPAVAAVAVMALLAFGVLVGSAVSPVTPSGAAPSILVALYPTATKVAKAPLVSQAPTSLPTTQAPTPLPASTTEPTATSTTPASTPSKPKSKSKGLSTPSPAAVLPPIKHVFLIMLSDQGVAAFRPGSPAPYLANKLAQTGELLENYFAVSNGELANANALISGQGPTTQTAGNCPQYTDVTPAAAGAEGQVLGSGCVYPRPTLTLGDQLTRAGKSWKAYIEGIEMGAAGQSTSCRHPALGAIDVNNAASPQDSYVTWRNPFVYFHSLIDSPQCAKDDVGLGRLASDLKKISTTPSLAYIVPDRCHDGSQAPCGPGAPAGLPATEAFLRKVVPQIKASAAYSQGALIAITFDQAPQSGPAADSSGCCMTAPFPNLPAATPTSVTPTSAPTTTSPAVAPNSTAPASTTPSTAPSSTTPLSPSSTSPSPSATGTTGVSGTPAATPTGGGRVGLLLISKYVKPASLNVTGEYNHFALLRSIENLFGLKPLGYAAAPGLLAFDSSVFNAYK